MASTIILSDNGASSGSAGLKQTAGNDGVLILQSTTSGGTATTALTIDNVQNAVFSKPIGLTVTPNAPTFPFNNAVIQSPTYTMYSWTSNGSLYLQTNAYYNSGWKYQQSSINPSQVTLGGGFDVGSSATGSAGAAITWTSVLGISGVGKTVYLEGGTQSLAGTGITFPATQNASTNANTLDDYEEGSWTPAYVSSGATFSVASQYGNYVKIGKMVFAQFYLNATASGTTGNSCQITGLPFTAANASALQQSGGAVWFSGTTCQPLVDANSTAISTWKGGAVALNTAADVSGKYLVGNVIYTASA